MANQHQLAKIEFVKVWVTRLPSLSHPPLSMWHHRVTCLPPENASAPWDGPVSRWLTIIVRQVNYIPYLLACQKLQRSTPHNIVKNGLAWSRVFHRRHLGRRVTAVTCLRWPTVFNRPDVIKYIQYLHDRFVIVPVDKASNNFGTVCKKFYLEVIQKELGISHNGDIFGNNVYIPVCQEAYDIYTNFIKTHFFVCLALSYWMKTKRFRYFIGLLNNIRTHINSVLWQELHTVIINKFQILKLHTVSKHLTYPFYIRIYHWTLYMEDSNPWSLIIKMFANSKSLAIWVNSYRKKALCSNGSSYPGYREYTINKLLEALEINLFNTYIQFNGTVFKQTLVWVEIHHPSLPIYTYYGVNIAMWLN